MSQDHKNDRNKSLLWVSLFLILLSSCHYPSKQLPVLKNGVMDMSNWNFSQQGILRLNGAWNFFWNKT